MINGHMVCHVLNTPSLKNLESMLIPILRAGTFSPSSCYFITVILITLSFSHDRHLNLYVLSILPLELICMTFNAN